MNATGISFGYMLQKHKAFLGKGFPCDRTWASAAVSIFYKIPHKKKAYYSSYSFHLCLGNKHKAKESPGRGGLLATSGCTEKLHSLTITFQTNISGKALQYKLLSVTGQLPSSNPDWDSVAVIKRRSNKLQIELSLLMAWNGRVNRADTGNLQPH